VTITLCVVCLETIHCLFSEVRVFLSKAVCIISWFLIRTHSLRKTTKALRRIKRTDWSIGWTRYCLPCHRC